MGSAEIMIPFSELGDCDLVVGTTYVGGEKRSIAGEPIDRILHCGNMGGFRIRGSVLADKVALVVLFTTFRDSDWPDALDEATGRFTYYGDNKSPGRQLHDTPKWGNEILRRCFDAIHVNPPRRMRVPPFFVFSKAEPGRSARFHGLAVPGAVGLTESEDLVALWKTHGSQRFQNYRAVFTILDAPRISRTWIDSAVAGKAHVPEAPGAWTQWVETGVSRALKR